MPAAIIKGNVSLAYIILIKAVLSRKLCFYLKSPQQAKPSKYISKENIISPMKK